MLLLVFGGLLIGTAAILDFIFRLRMTRVGHHTALLQGGAFNYAEYHKARNMYDWSAWPVYLMWVLFIGGIALLIGGFFVRFGTHPPHSQIRDL
jgi:hypothetical protein